MLRKNILCFIILLFGCASSDWRAKTVNFASFESSKAFEMDSISFGTGMVVKKYRLTNGLKIIILEDHSAPVFAYHTWFNVGSRNERDGITGIAHLFEHLMFKETKNTKEGEFDKILEEQGGRINAATYVDWTFYRESLPKEAFATVVSLEADRMQHMILNDAQVNSEREVVANERRFRVDNSPGGIMYEQLHKAAFSLHPYHWPVIGWMKDIQAINLKDCIEFYKTYYAPNNSTVVVVGDVETEEVLKTINKAYGAIPASTIPPEKIPSEPQQTEEKRIEIEQPIPAQKVLIGFHVPDSLHEDLPALSVAHALLFDGKSSRLYRRLITDSQIASEAGGWVNQTKDPGLQIIDISMKTGHQAQEALKIVYEELERLSKEDVSDDELQKAKNRLETSFWNNFKTADSKAESLGFHEIVSKDYRKLFEEIPRLKKVQASDVRRVATQYYVSQNRTLVVATPKANSQNAPKGKR